MRSALAIAALGIAGCAVRAYDGPRRASKEVALIETDGTKLTGVDRWRADGGKLEVLPGIHAVAVMLNDEHRQTPMGGDGYRYYSRAPLVVCFMALPGHTYEARPVYAGRSWQPEIVDESRAELVRSWLVVSRAAGCEKGSGETQGE